MVTHSSSGKPLLNRDEAAWLMAIAHTLTMQDMFEVVLELLQLILETRRRVPDELGSQMSEQTRREGLEAVVSNIIAISKEAHRE